MSPEPLQKHSLDARLVFAINLYRSQASTAVNPINRRSYASGTKGCVIESQASMISAIQVRLRPNYVEI